MSGYLHHISSLDIPEIKVSVLRSQVNFEYWLFSCACKKQFFKSVTLHVRDGDLEFWVEDYRYNLTPLKKMEKLLDPLLFWVKFFAPLKFCSGRVY